jgi:hypothetical protein
MSTNPAADLLSASHCTVDGTLIEAWASLKSVRPKGERPEDRPPPDDPDNPTVHFHGERRSNATHAWRSRTATRCWRGRATARRRRAPWRGMSSWRTATACASTSWSPARADRGAGGSAHGGLAPAVSARRGQSLRHGRLRRRSARRREYSARGADHHAAAGFDPHVIDAFFRNLLGAQASKSASAGSLRSPP